MAASLTKFKYGAYTVDDGDARLLKHEIVAAMSQRGDRWGEWRRMVVEVELQAASPTALNTKMNDFLNAFSQNDQTAVLLFPDDSETKHKLDQADINNYSGNKVIHLSWLDTDAGQLVNARTCRVVIQALFRNADSQILSYRDDIEVQGDGGPKWKWVLTSTGQPVQQQTSLFSPQVIKQAGFIFALDTWASGNIPPPILPNYEHRELRNIQRIYPKYKGAVHAEYGMSWHYIMESPPGSPVPTQSTPF